MDENKAHSDQKEANKGAISTVQRKPYQQANTSTGLAKMLQDFDVFADYIISSDYRTNFEKAAKDEHGAILKDDSGRAIKTVDKGDIIACLVLGQELGISPMGSIVLGKQLNAKSYFSVMRGKELGLDSITSISKIYNIETNNGNILSMDYTLIAKVIIETVDTMEYVRDHELTPTYVITTDKSYAGHHHQLFDNGKIKEGFFLYIPKVTPNEELSNAVNTGLIIIQSRGTTRVTSLRIVRTSINLNKTFHYSLQEATDAGLYRGYHSTLVDNAGKPVYMPGRDNWNKHEATMLRNRVTSIAGRLAVADKINAYSHEEAMEIINVKSEEELLEG